MSDVSRMLKGSDRVRLRPAVIFGDDGLDGAIRAVEMVMCIMEAECIDGYSSRLEVTLHSDFSMSIHNFGRGIFFGETPAVDERVWKNMFCGIPADPMYGNHQAHNTRYSIFGEPGTAPERKYGIDVYDNLSLCVVQFASEYMDVMSVRDGFEYRLHFKKGENIGGLCLTTVDLPSRTRIRFKLDEEVFSDISIPRAFLEERLKALALHNPGITCLLCSEPEGSRKEYCFPAGIRDYLRGRRSPTCDFPVYTNVIEGMGQERYNRPAYKARVEVGISFEANNGFVECYHNQRALPHGGTHIETILSEIQDGLQCFAGNNLSTEQIKKHLQLVVISYSSATTLWENGTHRSICSTVISDMAETALGDCFREFLIDNDSVKSIFTYK